jgi:hypothetical protein
LIKASQFDYAVSSLIKANDFTDNFNDLTFYVEKKDENNQMKNIFIRDENSILKSLVSEEKKSQNTTIFAKTGFLEKNRLILKDGLIQSKNTEGKFSNIKFEKTEFFMENIKSRTIVDPKLQETVTSSLITCYFNTNENITNLKIDSC